MKPLSFQIRVLLTLGALLIVIEVANLLTGNALNQFGVLCSGDTARFLSLR